MLRFSVTFRATTPGTSPSVYNEIDGQYLKSTPSKPITYSTVMDRDGDGLIKTSRGLANILPWTNQRFRGLMHDVDTLGGVATAEDEAITEFVRVRDYGTRTIAVDKLNDIWVGGTRSDRTHQKISGMLAAVVANSSFTTGYGGYGGVIDAAGVLWSSTGDWNNHLLRFIPPATFPPGWVPTLNVDYRDLTDGGDYGLAVDPNTGQVWHTSYDSSFYEASETDGRITRWESTGLASTTYWNHGNQYAQGVVVDRANINGANNVWVAHSSNAGVHTIGHLRASDGKFIGLVNLSYTDSHGNPVTDIGPTGVAVDSRGYVWVGCKNSSTAMRINPNGGDASEDRYKGAVDLVVDLGDGTGHPAPYDIPASPHNYSDMTGFNNAIVNPGTCPLRGYWTVVEDNGTPQASWKLSWVANTPSGTSLEVYARASDERVTLSNQRFVQSDGLNLLPGVRGRFLEVRVSLTRDSCAKDPYIDSLTICGLSSTLQLTTGLTDQTFTEGQTDPAPVLQVVAAGTEPLVYQWFVNGNTIVGASGPVLQLGEIDCLDNTAQYTVRVTDASGDTVVSGPATLNVVSRAIAINFSGIAEPYPAQIVVAGAPTTISSVDVVLYGFSHTFPDDVDILLVSPRGKAVMLMSDAGGGSPVANLTLTFSQSAFPISDENTLYSGTYTPANYGESETQLPLAIATHPSPPAGPYSTDLGILNGDDPNGIWRLYVVDDTPQYAGQISGSWCLVLNP